MSVLSERTTDYELNNTTFRVMYSDITKLEVDAIVSSDDNYLSMGGGVSSAILNAGGDSIRQDAVKQIPLQMGEVAVTTAGKLSAKFVFHAITIDYTDMKYPSEVTIKEAILRCMQLADILRIKSIAFPALGTGSGHFPFELAADVMTRTITDYLVNQTSISLVILSLYSRHGLVRIDDLNLFYERAVAHASESALSNRLNSLLSDLKNITNSLDMPSVVNDIEKLQFSIEKARDVLATRPTNIEHLEQLGEQSKLEESSKKIIDMSSRIVEDKSTKKKELDLTEDILRTNLTGLQTQLNIKMSHKNRFEIERAKYGGIGVPPRLDIAIDDLKAEISQLEEQIRIVKSVLIALH
jgi:O-acetyl-ADP-ribose deacetylase (regulator of RNase III)